MSLEWLRLFVSRRWRAAKPFAPWLCAALGSYAVWLLFNDAFLWYIGDDTFVTSVLLLLPFLLAMSPLVRARAWVGVGGAAVFFATALAMLVLNGSTERAGWGFFGNWIT